jgi:hypothetical protein
MPNLRHHAHVCLRSPVCLHSPIHLRALSPTSVARVVRPRLDLHAPVSALPPLLALGPMRSFHRRPWCPCTPVSVLPPRQPWCPRAPSTSGPSARALRCLRSPPPAECPRALPPPVALVPVHSGVHAPSPGGPGAHALRRPLCAPLTGSLGARALQHPRSLPGQFFSRYASTSSPPTCMIVALTKNR